MTTPQIKRIRSIVCMILGVGLIAGEFILHALSAEREVSWAIITAGLTCLGLIPAFRWDERRQNENDKRY